MVDAIYQPRIAEHQSSSRQFAAAAARNDVLRDAALAYLELLRAEQGMAIAKEAQEKTQKLAELTRQYAESGQGLQADYQRMQAELALREEQLTAQAEAGKSPRPSWLKFCMQMPRSRSPPRDDRGSLGSHDR